MSSALLDFLRTLTLAKEDPIYDELESILKTPDSIFKYILQPDVEPLSSGKYEGVSSTGQLCTFMLSIPNCIEHPPPTPRHQFPYTDTTFGFRFQPKVNHLPTFDVNDLFSKAAIIQSENELEYKILTTLLADAQFQSRVGPIWKQTAAMIALLKANYPSTHVVRRYYQFLLGRYPAAPFHERNKQIEWETHGIPTVSILPLLVHGAGHLAIMCLTETIQEIDAVVCIHHWLSCVEKNFQDTKLATQKQLRNLLPQALHQMPSPQRIPKWSTTGTLLGVWEKSTREPACVTSTFSAMDMKRQELLDTSVLNYVKALYAQTTFDSLMRGYHVARVIANDGTYFGSLPELSIDAAVLPKVQDHIIRTLSPQSHLTTTQVLLYDQNSSPVFGPSYRYLTRAFGRWRHMARRLLGNLNGEIIPFLTSSSSSSPAELLSGIRSQSKLVSNAIGRRIVTFAYEIRDLMDLTKFRQRLSEPVKAVERKQISRRPRAISGVNNPRILASLPFLRALEILQKIVHFASSGKQSGNVNDVSHMMYQTSRDNILNSSMDVSGCDASVQMTSQTQLISMISEQLGPVCGSRYLCYGPMQHPNGTDGQISSLSLLGSDIMTRLQPQSTVLVGKVVPRVHQTDPTFPSGLAHTTAHHTIRLGSAIMGEACDRMVKNHEVTSLQEISVQGDDLKLSFVGSEERTSRDLRHAQNAINHMGFETDSEASRSTMEFLQQRAILGRPVLYPDRVSLLTAEKPREAKGPMDKVNELLALAYDLGNRVKNPHTLVPILYSLYLFCAAKITIRVSRSAMLEIKDKHAKLWKHLRMATLFDSMDRSPEAVFVTMMCPISYAWVCGGPGLPPPSYPRSDGTYTPPPNFYSLRGAYQKTFLFNLSLTDPMWTRLFEADDAGAIIEPWRLLDQDHLASLGVTAGAQLAKVISAFTSLKDEEIDKREGPNIAAMAHAIKPVQNLKRLERSENAYKELLTKNFKLSRALVVAYEGETKLRGAIKEADEAKFDTIEKCDKFLQDLISASRERSITKIFDLHKEDYSCIYRCEWVEGTRIVPDIAGDIIRDESMTLASDLFPNSIGHALVSYLGTRTLLGQHSDPYLRGTQRVFKDMVRGDELLEAGFRIMREAPHLMPTFATAVGLTQDQEMRLQREALIYASNAYTYHRIIYSPRQYFFIDSDPVKIEPHVDTHPGLLPETRALCLVQAQEWLSYNIIQSRGRRIRVRTIHNTIARKRGVRANPT